MKRNLIFTTLLAGCMAGAAAQEFTYKWGQADTVECHSVGPGMTYAKVIFPDKPLILWWVDVDLKNPYAKVEQVQSRHSVPDTKRWDVMTHYRENSRPEHQVKVAWNHDFFSYDDGICIGINISEGEMTWNKWGRSLLAITDEGDAEVFYPAMDAHVEAPDGTTVVIDYFNSHASGASGDCILYNRLNARTLTEQGRYIALEPLDPWIVNGTEPVRCRVVQISDAPIQTAENLYVLFLQGWKTTLLDGHLAVNDVLGVVQRFDTVGFGTPPERILNAFHGYPSIVRNGVLHDGEFNDFENGREYEKSSRVMAGISQDKTHLYVATTELSAKSAGVDCIELSAWMVEHGAWDVVNFDSGGSAAIVIDGEMLNLPGRGAVRPVEDAMLAVSLAPEDNNVDHLTFSVPAIAPSVISRTPLRVMSFNQYGEVLQNDIEGCTFEVDPPTMGYVDSDAIFHSSTATGIGRIIARKDGMEAELRVTNMRLGDISPKYSSLLLDDKRRYVIEICGKSALGDVAVDPGAFSWTMEPEGIVEISADGVMTGIAPGTTAVAGHFDDVEVKFDVTVEPSQPCMQLLGLADTEALGLNTPSAMKNLTISTTGLPEGFEGGVALDFDLSPARGATMKMSPECRLYSLPDSLGIHISDRTGAVKSVLLQIVDSQKKRISISADVPQGESTLVFPMRDEDGEIFATGRYPLTLRTISFNLNNATIPESQILLGTLDGYYTGYSGIESVLAWPCDAAPLSVRVAGETLYVSAADVPDGEYAVKICDMTGHSRLAASAHFSAGVAAVGVKTLPTGLYVLQLGLHRAVKFVVR